LYRYRVEQIRSRLQLVVDERFRVARELHDTLLQGFTGVVFQLEAAARQFLHSPDESRRRMDLALEQADQSMKEARYAVSCMRLSALEDKPLPEALKATVRQMREGTSIRIDLAQKGTARRLPYEVEANLFIIAREAMNNAINHGKPSRIFLELAFSADSTRLLIEDDGIGYDTNLPQKEGHLGLTGIRERVRMIGGSLTVESSSGSGTKVEIVVPSKVHSHP
jgi:signal transduction histidine kinase